MAIAVTCPNCQSRFEIAPDLADQPLRCHHCMHVFERVGARTRSEAVGIHAGAPSTASAPRDEDWPPATAPRRMASPRPVFPCSALYLVVIGLLFFLLVVSVGFNMWVALGAEGRIHRDDEFRAVQQQAQAQRMQAEANAEVARQQQIQATLRSETLQRQNQELKRQVDILRAQLEDAKRPLDKEP